MKPRQQILDALSAEDEQDADSEVAAMFDVHPLAVRSARHIVEKALDRSEPLSKAIDSELAAEPGLVGPVPKIAHYVGRLLTDQP